MKDYKKRSMLKHTVLVFEGDTVTRHPVFSITEGRIETDSTIMPEEEATKYFNKTDSSITYVYNMSHHAVVESELLKKMKRSVILSKMFNYAEDKGFDLMRWMPWIIIVCLILFK